MEMLALYLPVQSPGVVPRRHSYAGYLWQPHSQLLAQVELWNRKSDDVSKNDKIADKKIMSITRQLMVTARKYNNVTNK